MRAFLVSMKLQSAAHPGFGPDRPSPIGESRYKAEILADMLLADPAHRYPLLLLAKMLGGDAIGEEGCVLDHWLDLLDRDDSLSPDCTNLGEIHGFS